MKISKNGLFLFSTFVSFGLIFLSLLTLSSASLRNPSYDDFTYCEEGICYIEKATFAGDLRSVYAFVVDSQVLAEGEEDMNAELLYYEKYGKKNGVTYLKLKKYYYTYGGRDYSDIYEKYDFEGNLIKVKWYDKIPFEDELIVNGKVVKKLFYDLDGSLSYMVDYDLSTGNIVRKVFFDHKGKIDHGRQYDLNSDLILEYSSPKSFLYHKPAFKGEPQLLEEFEDYFYARHNATKLKIALNNGSFDVVMFGDSITDGLSFQYSGIVDEFYPNESVLIAAVGGDSSSNLLWRLNDGVVNGLHEADLFLLNIGSNDVAFYGASVSKTFSLIEATIVKLRNEFPDTEILITGPLPRGEWVFDIPGQKISSLNKDLKFLSYEDPMIYYTNLEDLFVQQGGYINSSLMPDYIHPNEEGHRLIQEAIRDTVQSLLDN